MFKFSSRAMLLGTALCAAGLMASCGKNDAPIPKNLIFFLGDGYGMVPMTASRIYTVGESGELPIDKFPETAFVKTYSNNAQVTDSAPSMSAYMTGVKMNNDVIAMSQDTVATTPGNTADSQANNCMATNGQIVTSLLELAKNDGRGTGVVTTTRVTHATPAATFAHICHRDAENAIAAEAVPGGAGYNTALGSDGLDVLLGGGFRHWLPNTVKGGLRVDGRDLTAEMQAKGYTYVNKGTSLAALDATKLTKLLGLFTNSHMDFDLDRTIGGLDQPSLTQMTTKALDVLSKNPKGFFLMVEGGRIDQALHPTLARKAMQEAKEFNNAIQAAIDKANVFDPGLKNTLIVVTADHDHTMVMNGYSALTGATTATHPGILGLFRYYTSAENADGSTNSIDSVTPTNDADGVPYTTLVFGNGENRVQGARNSMAALTDAQVFDKEYHQEAAIRMPAGGETHGGADVFLGAMGLNADLFHGVMDNTKVFALCKTAVGL